MPSRSGPCGLRGLTAFADRPPGSLKREVRGGSIRGMGRLSVLAQLSRGASRPARSSNRLARCPAQRTFPSADAHRNIACNSRNSEATPSGSSSSSSARQ
jgi:hypothetical protein